MIGTQSLTSLPKRLQTISGIVDKRRLWWSGIASIRTLRPNHKSSPEFEEAATFYPPDPEACVTPDATSENSPTAHVARITMAAGETLKSLRNKRNITVRDVEQASRR